MATEVLTESPPNPSQAQPTANSWVGQTCDSLFTYYLTSLIVVFGATFGYDFIKGEPNVFAMRTGFLDACANWDGKQYKEIAEIGYNYDPSSPGNLTYFPAYPLLARAIAYLTGMSIVTALLLVAHLSLAASFVVLAAYVRRRFPADASNLAAWTLVAFGVWPTTMFFRMAYSESLFLLSAVLVLYGIEKKWPLLLIGLIVGFATATRSVGICLAIPMAWHMWRISPNLWLAMRRLYLVPVMCWGIVGFMIYQYLEFGEPLAFVKAHDWRMREPIPWSTRVLDLITLEPVRAVFDPDSACCWQRFAKEVNPLFSLQFANPFYWVAALALVGLGIWKRWLTDYEWSLALCLLVVPYLLRGHEMCMGSMGRYSAVAFPMYLVLGHLLARLPGAVATSLLGVGAFILGVYAALFAAWYRFW